MTTISSRDYQSIAKAISEDKSFKTYGSLRGIYCPEGSPWSWGRLDYDHRATVKDADYVIYSYQTPIAWRTQGQWIQPAARYSVTTSKQQSTVRLALQLLS